jgi:multiple sugar transport system permease protein
MVIYIAALQSIEPDIYESSSIDGANSWQTFRLITLPSILRVVELQLFISLSGALQAFTESLVLTRGGPAKATYTFMYYVIDSFVNFSDYGRAAAMSVLLIVLILAIAGIQRLVVRRGATI